MNKTVRKVIMIISVIVLAGSIAALIIHQSRYSVERENNLEAADLAGIPERISVSPAEVSPAAQNGSAEEEDPYLSDVYAVRLASLDLEALQAVNPEIIGWISIPGTDIDFPLIHHSDNKYFLRRSWKGEYSISGSIFMECKCSPDFSDFNTIIYGHHMKDGSMFAPLRHYKEEVFLEEHPWVYIRTEDEIRRYDIFACYEATLKAPVYYLYIEDEERKQELIDYSLESSLFSGPVTPSTEDSLLSLSTCTGNGHQKRIIVQSLLEYAEPLGNFIPVL